jgi:serine/threonine protein kinase/Tfp pilus assembly protein PilF
LTGGSAISYDIIAGNSRSGVCLLKCPKCNKNVEDDSRYCSACGAELPERGHAENGRSQLSETRPLGRQAGEGKIDGIVAGKYKITEELGRGGMGRVYKAEDIRLKRPVALKFLPPDLGRDKEARERFVREAQAASALDHPNICTIYEIDETEQGQMFIAMAFYGGESLKDRIERGPLGIEEALNIGVQAAEGLARAHEAGMVHRDIKPANILITPRDEVKIVDFGLAKLTGKHITTRLGAPIGTVLYMSPEQARGQKVDTRTDIWALGVVLYEMLTGVLPFPGENEQAVIYSILNVDPKAPTFIHTGIPPALEKVILKAIRKEADARYADAEAILADLRKLKNEFDTTGAIRSQVRVGDDSDTIVIWEPKPVAVISFENDTGDASYDYLRKAIPNLLITSLEQTKYLRVVTWERMQDLLKQLGREETEVIGRDLGYEICRLGGIEAIVLGSFTKAGEVFATDVKVIDVETKNLLKSASSKGQGVDSILQKQIDQLSKEISKGVGISEKRIEESRHPIAEVTTESMEAYNLFIKGRECYEKLYNDEARRSFEKAIELDPTFAAAYLYLAFVEGRLRNIRARDEAYMRAMEHGAKANRKERMYIEAAYAVSIEGDIKKRFRILRQLAAEYPDEKFVHQQLASHYRVNELFYQAVEEYDKVLDLDPNYGWAMNELGYMYADAGYVDRAHEYFKRYAAVSPGEANPIDSMAELYFRMGKLDDAIAKYQEVLELKPDFYYAYWEIAYVFALKEDYASAIEWIARFLAKTPSFGTRAEGLQWKAFYHYWTGRFDQALDNIRELLEMAEKEESDLWKTAAHRMMGWIYLDQEDYELSRRHFETCLESVAANPQAFIPAQKSYMLWTRDMIPTLRATYSFALALIDIKEGHLRPAELRYQKVKPLLPESAEVLRAELLLAKGSPDKAITVCEKAAPWKVPYMSDTDGMLAYNLPPMKDTLARAHATKGSLDRAIEEYTRLVTFDPNSKDRRFIHPRYYQSLATLYDEKSQPAGAARAYDKFQSLWGSP